MTIKWEKADYSVGSSECIQVGRDTSVPDWIHPLIFMKTQGGMFVATNREFANFVAQCARGDWNHLIEGYEMTTPAEPSADPDIAVIEAMKGIVVSDAVVTRAALMGLSRDDVYSLKHKAMELIGFVEERFEELPEE